MQLELPPLPHADSNRSRLHGADHTASGVDTNSGTPITHLSRLLSQQRQQLKKLNEEADQPPVAAGAPLPSLIHIPSKAASRSLAAALSPLHLTPPSIEQYVALTVSVPPLVAFNLLATPDSTQLFAIPAGVASCVLVENLPDDMKLGPRRVVRSQHSGFRPDSMYSCDQTDEPGEAAWIRNRLGLVRRTCLQLPEYREKLLRERLVAVERGPYVSKVVYEYLPFTTPERQATETAKALPSGTGAADLPGWRQPSLQHCQRQPHPCAIPEIDRCPFAQRQFNSQEDVGERCHGSTEVHRAGGSFTTSTRRATDGSAQSGEPWLVDPLENAKTYTTFTIQSLGGSAADLASERSCFISIHTTVSFPVMEQMIAERKADQMRYETGPSAVRHGNGGRHQSQHSDCRYYQNGMSNLDGDADELQWLVESSEMVITKEARQEVQFFFQRYNEALCSSLEEYLVSLVFPIKSQRLDGRCREEFEEMEHVLVKWAVSARQNPATPAARRVAGAVGSAMRHARSNVDKEAADTISRNEAIIEMDRALSRWAKVIKLYEHEKRLANSLRCDVLGSAQVAERAAANLAALAASVAVGIQSESATDESPGSGRADATNTSASRVGGAVAAEAVDSRRELQGGASAADKLADAGSKYGTKWASGPPAPVEAVRGITASMLRASAATTGGNERGAPAAVDKVVDPADSATLASSPSRATSEEDTAPSAHSIIPSSTHEYVKEAARGPISSPPDAFDPSFVRAVLARGVFNEESAHAIFRGLYYDTTHQHHIENEQCREVTGPREGKAAGEAASYPAASKPTDSETRTVAAQRELSGKLLSKSHVALLLRTVGLLGSISASSGMLGDLAAETALEADCVGASRAFSAPLAERMYRDLAEKYVKKYDFHGKGQLNYDEFCLLLLGFMK